MLWDYVIDLKCWKALKLPTTDDITQNFRLVQQKIEIVLGGDMGQAFGLEYECGQGPYRTLLLILFLCEENSFKVTILAHIMLPI